jgi:putative peptidoglycan lipid II flippase
MLPVSVFGMSIAAAELPQMAGETGTGEEVKAALSKRLDRSIRQVAFFVIPSVVALIVFGRLLVAALYERGRFDANTTLIVSYILAGASIGLLAATLGRLYSSAFYALQDTRTPFRIALARVTGGAALAVLFAFPLRPIFPAMIRALGLPLPNVPGAEALIAVMGISAASAIASWIEFILLRRGIRRRVGAGEPKASYMLQLWIAALVAGAAAFFLDHTLALPHVLEAMVVSGVFGGVYFGMALAFAVPEARSTLGRLRRR